MSKFVPYFIAGLVALILTVLLMYACFCFVLQTGNTRDWTEANRVAFVILSFFLGIIFVSGSIAIVLEGNGE